MSRAGLSVFVLMAALSLPTAAHHSYSIYDLGSIVTLQGTVTRYAWGNPHVYVFIEAPDTSGAPVEWELEADPTPMMTRNGWTASTLALGDRVTVRANPGKNPDKPQGLLDSLTTPDGLLLRRRASGRAADAQAETIAGVWDGLRGFGRAHFSAAEPTPKGRAAQSRYDITRSPVADCIPAPPPSINNAPHLHGIELLADRVLIKTEYFDVTRTVYMDGRDHPEDGERTNQGHSIGRWDGDTLVVDTRLFADHLTGNMSAIPSGPQKHLVERYRLSDDRRQLLIDFALEDPEYLQEPITGQFAWDYAPDRALLPSGCDLATARRYLLP